MGPPSRGGSVRVVVGRGESLVRVDRGGPGLAGDGIVQPRSARPDLGSTVGLSRSGQPRSTEGWPTSAKA